MTYREKRQDSFMTQENISSEEVSSSNAERRNKEDVHISHIET